MRWPACCRPRGRQGGAEQAIGDLQVRTTALRGAHGAVKRGWSGLVTPPYRDSIRAAMRCTYLAREWMLIDQPWHPGAETRAVADRASRRIAAMKDALAPGSGTAVQGQPAQAPKTMAVAVLLALDESIARLAATTAPLLRRRR